MTTVLCSGGFDPLHDGHLDYLEGAREYGQVVVALNSDAWLARKKGWVFMPWGARARLLRALYMVEDVISVDDGDNSVQQAIRAIRPIYFANGGDRMSANPLEHETCKKLNVKELFGVGGPKKRSSSAILPADAKLVMGYKYAGMTAAEIKKIRPLVYYNDNEDMPDVPNIPPPTSTSETE